MFRLSLVCNVQFSKWHSLFVYSSPTSVNYNLDIIGGFLRNRSDSALIEAIPLPSILSILNPTVVQIFHSRFPGQIIFGRRSGGTVIVEQRAASTDHTAFNLDQQKVVRNHLLFPVFFNVDPFLQDPRSTVAR